MLWHFLRCVLAVRTLDGAALAAWLEKPVLRWYPPAFTCRRKPRDAPTTGYRSLTPPAREFHRPVRRDRCWPESPVSRRLRERSPPPRLTPRRFFLRPRRAKQNRRPAH